jgi:hypothetical protein
MEIEFNKKSSLASLLQQLKPIFLNTDVDCNAADTHRISLQHSLYIGIDNDLESRCRRRSQQPSAKSGVRLIDVGLPFGQKDVFERQQTGH